MSDLIQKVRKNLDVQQLIPVTGRLILGVSGGLDSMVLLAVFHRLAQAKSLKLVVAHANHQLRSRESDGDAALVKRVSKRFQLPCIVERLAVRQTLEHSQESMEMVARRLRHRFFAQAARNRDIQTLALAHHADDQAELILLRLLRGAGAEGLGGMGWKGPSPVDPALTLIRPFLDIPRRELEVFAEENRIPFREDSSNHDLQIPRNRIRQELLPWLEREYNPGLRNVLQHTAQLLYAEADFMAIEARRWLHGEERASFRELHPALQREIVRQQLWELGHVGDFDLVERLRTSTGSVSAATNLFLRCDPGGKVKVATPQKLAFQLGEFAVQIRPGRKQILWNGVKITMSLGRSPGIPTKARPSQELFDATRVGDRIAFRHWQPGDRFQPLGTPAPSKLQNLYVNRKVPAAQRRSLLIGVNGSGTIFWVESLPPGELFKVTPNTRQVLRLQWHRDSQQGQTSLAPKTSGDSLSHR